MYACNWYTVVGLGHAWILSIMALGITFVLRNQVFGNTQEFDRQARYLNFVYGWLTPRPAKLLSDCVWQFSNLQHRA